MVDDGDKLKEKVQKGGNEIQNLGHLFATSFYFCFLLYMLRARISFSFLSFLRIRESELLSLLILDSHSCWNSVSIDCSCCLLRFCGMDSFYNFGYAPCIFRI